MRYRPTCLLLVLLAASGFALPAAAQTPLGPPVPLIADEPCGRSNSPQGAGLAGGGAVVVWRTTPETGPAFLEAQRLDVEGRPEAPAVPLDAPLDPQEWRLAAGPASWAVAWEAAAGGTFAARVFGLDRQPLGPVVPLGGSGNSLSDLAGGPDGSYLAVISDEPDLRVVRFEPDGTVLDDFALTVAQEFLFTLEATATIQALGGSYVGYLLQDIRTLDNEPYVIEGVQNPSLPVVGPRREIPGAHGLDLASLPDGRLVAVYQDETERLVLDVMAADLALEASYPLEPGTEPGLVFPRFPRLAVGPEGTVAVLWGQPVRTPVGTVESRRVLQTVDPDRGPVGEPVPIGAFERDGVLTSVAEQTFVAPGRVAVLWSQLRPMAAETSCAIDNVFAQTFTTRCTADAQTLCLQNDRFAVQVAWEDPRSGDTGVGTAQPVTGDTGTFWFFNDDNLELMVKVLDGRLINGHWWVFYGSLTDVEFVMTVRDAVTGEERQFTNPPFTMASEGNVTAFEEAP